MNIPSKWFYVLRQIYNQRVTAKWTRRVTADFRVPLTACFLCKQAAQLSC